MKYIGMPGNTDLHGMKIKVVPVGMNASDTRWMSQVSDPCIHYIVRDKNATTKAQFKPFTKGILAAHTNSLVVAEEGLYDHDYYLSDYPFLIKSGDSPREVVQRTIDSVKSRDSDFKKAREVMEYIKKETMPQVIVDQFVNMIKSI